MPSLISPITSGAIDAALNSLVQADSGSVAAGSADEPRSAMVFTSHLRQALAGNTSVQTQRIEALQDLRDLTGQMRGANRNIVTAINPKSIEFRQPKRYSRQDTQRGSVFHHFT